MAIGIWINAEVNSTAARLSFLKKHRQGRRGFHRRDAVLLGWMKCQVMTHNTDAAGSAGHVKKPDLLCMRPVERKDRLGGGLQQYLAALFREICLSFRR